MFCNNLYVFHSSKTPDQIRDIIRYRYKLEIGPLVILHFNGKPSIRMLGVLPPNLYTFLENDGYTKTPPKEFIVVPFDLKDVSMPISRKSIFTRVADSIQNPTEIRKHLMYNINQYVSWGILPNDAVEIVIPEYSVKIGKIEWCYINFKSHVSDISAGVTRIFLNNSMWWGTNDRISSSWYNQGKRKLKYKK